MEEIPALALAWGLYVLPSARRTLDSAPEPTRALEECSQLGATIAIGAAGAIVYFSHRGGSDFLGKCDPWVARQPIHRPDATSGHNKRYVKEIFERDRPEFSREKPPSEFASQYRECEMRGHRVWVRLDAPNALWDRLRPLH